MVCGCSPVVSLPLNVRAPTLSDAHGAHWLDKSGNMYSVLVLYSLLMLSSSGFHLRMEAVASKECGMGK